MSEKLKKIRRKYTIAAAVLAAAVIAIILLLILGAVPGDVKGLLIVLLCILGIVLSRCIFIAADPSNHSDGRFLPLNKAQDLHSELCNNDAEKTSDVSAVYNDTSVSFADDKHGKRSAARNSHLTFHSELFGCDIKVEAENVSDEYISRCIKLFQNMSDDDKAVIIRDALADRERIAELSGDDDGLPGNISGEEIFRYIHPKTMYIDAADGREPDEAEFLIEADADWYDGFEIAAVNGRIVGAGEYSGDLDIWRDRIGGEE